MPLGILGALVLGNVLEALKTSKGVASEERGYNVNEKSIF